MANQEHLDVLRQGILIWNRWREEHIDIWPDLSGADLNRNYLSSANFSGVDLSKVDLSGADLRGGNLSGADLSGANLSKAEISGTDDIKVERTDEFIRILTEKALISMLGDMQDQATTFLNNSRLIIGSLIGSNLYRGTDLSYANLREANLRGANFYGANFYGADLREADLSFSRLVKTNLTEANLTSCRVYGIAAWDVQLKQTIQNSLIITPYNETQITVDNLKVAQFIYLLLTNKEIRDVIDTITSKVVLILGRFTPERKRVLDALQDELRKKDYLPIVFDFQKPANRDLTETVSTLAHLARFVIADLTDAKSIPQELMLIVPNLPSVPVQPLILSSQHEYGMFEHFTRFSWVLPIYRYADQESLLQSINKNVIEPAEEKIKELERQ